MTDEHVPSFDIDPDDITAGEMEDIEEYVGMSFSEIMDELGEGKQPPAKVLTAFLYVAGKREDPNYTFEQARAIKVRQFKTIGEGKPVPKGEGTPPEPGG